MNTPPSGSRTLDEMKSIASRKSLPATFRPPVREMADGTPIAKMTIPRTHAALARGHPLSMKYAHTTSSSEMEDVSAAMKSRMKNSADQIIPPVIFAKTPGSVTNVRPGPAPASTPNAKTAGKMTRPARKATIVSMKHT